MASLQTRPSPKLGRGAMCEESISQEASCFLEQSHLARNIHEGMHVRQDAVVPDKARPFNPPEMPLLVVFHLLVLLEGQVYLVDGAVGLDDFHHLVGIFLSVRRENG